MVGNYEVNLYSGSFCDDLRESCWQRFKKDPSVKRTSVWLQVGPKVFMAVARLNCLNLAIHFVKRDPMPWFT